MSPLAELYANKKTTNHSVRKLKPFGFPKCELKNITGHCSERGRDAYNSGNQAKMFAMSSAISKSKCKYFLFQRMSSKYKYL